MEVDKLDIDKLFELDVDKLKPIPIDLKNLTDAVDNEVVQNNSI